MNQGILSQLPQPPAMPYGLLGRPTPVPMPAVDYALDVDAADYIRRVEAADGQALELPVTLALDTFIRGCKADATLNAIKACCILAGARTLSGALIPLVGTAPTNFNFVAADYNRKTGLVGNGNTKYLNSNRANNADPQDSNHNACWATSIGDNSFFGSNEAATGSNRYDTAPSINRSRIASRASSVTVTRFLSSGLYGASRNNSSQFVCRISRENINVVQASLTPDTSNVLIFANFSGATPTRYSNSRLSFYSIGEALDLALLDARVTQLMNALAVAL